MTKPDDLVNSVYRGESDGIYPGLTKREYFSVIILQGIMSSDKYGPTSDSYVATRAIKAADALIEQLNENPYELD
jgi:hypothetical protein